MLIKHTFTVTVLFPGEFTRSLYAASHVVRFVEEATGFQAGVEGKTRAVIANGVAHEWRSVPMRQEKETNIFCHSKVSGCLRVCYIPTPRGPVATYAVSPGMCGMSPAHWGSRQSRGPKASPPLLRNFEPLRDLDSSWSRPESLTHTSLYATGCHPIRPISLSPTLITTFSRIMPTL